MAVPGGAPVDHHFVIALRRPPGHEPPRIEAGIADPVARTSRRPVATERLAVLADELAVALDRRLGRRDTRDRADAIHERRADRSALGRTVRLDLRSAADHRVGAGGRTRDEIPEAGPQGVREHE